jgi:hypothetical protein
MAVVHQAISCCAVGVCLKQAKRWTSKPLTADSVCWMFYNSPEQQNTGNRIPQERVLQNVDFGGWDIPQPYQCKFVEASASRVRKSTFVSWTNQRRLMQASKQTTTSAWSSLGRLRNIRRRSRPGETIRVSWAADGCGPIRICRDKRGLAPTAHVQHSHYTIRIFKVSRAARVFPSDSLVVVPQLDYILGFSLLDPRF